MDHVNVPAKFEVCSSPVPEIIVIGVLGRGCKPQNWGRGGHGGLGMILFESIPYTDN